MSTDTKQSLAVTNQTHIAHVRDLFSKLCEVKMNLADLEIKYDIEKSKDLDSIYKLTGNLNEYVASIAKDMGIDLASGKYRFNIHTHEFEQNSVES